MFAFDVSIQVMFPWLDVLLNISWRTAPATEFLHQIPPKRVYHLFSFFLKDCHTGTDTFHIPTRREHHNRFVVLVWALCAWKCEIYTERRGDDVRLGFWCVTDQPSVGCGSLEAVKIWYEDKLQQQYFQNVLYPFKLDRKQIAHHSHFLS